MKKILYVDMDGTIALYPTNVSIEDMTRNGYFRRLPEMHNVLEALKYFLKYDPDIEIRSLSSVFNDDHSIREKTEWLHEKFPELDDDKMFFVPFGVRKRDYVADADHSFLLDDFSKNLHEWKGVGIKMYNGINGTHGTWHGFCVKSDMKPWRLYRQIKGIMISEEGFGAQE